MDKNNNKQPVKFNWLYLFWVLCILVLLNGLLFPVVGGAGVESTDYGTFIQRVDSGLVSKVQIKDNDIFYTILRQGKEQQCETP
ncbi:MAG: ATP-dependent metallopeptidase FtsH/Yme1/Tma family protein, partial [Prevotella sp.]